MTRFDDEITQTFVPRASPPQVGVADWGMTTSIGHRRLENEDAAGHAAHRRFAVADGMGGTAGGLLAAETAVHEFLRIDASMGWVPKMIELNLRVLEVCTAQGFAAAGSTIVGLDVEDSRCVTVHVGDSRIYRLRNGHLQLLTSDHNLRNLRLDEGRDPEETDERGAPQALTSWIGAHGEPDRIDVGTLAVEPGDRVLLVTDGVSGQLPPERIEAILAAPMRCQDAAATLVSESDEAGGRDNATALLVELEVRP